MLLREAIRARRSVRRYTERRIGLEQLLALVDCGRRAPGISAGAEAIVAIFAAENLLLAATDAGLGACVVRVSRGASPWGRRLGEPVVTPAEIAIAGAPAIELTARPTGRGRAGADTASLRTALRQHLSYLASSAHGLLTEPPSYGPYRLADSLSRLILVMEGGSHEGCRRVRVLVGEHGRHRPGHSGRPRA